MLFKELNFNDKQTVLKVWRWKIIKKVLEAIDFDVSRSSLNRYVEYLLEDTHYNPSDDVFYDPISRFKFTVDIFTSITVEYIYEHPSEFEK